MIGVTIKNLIRFIFIVSLFLILGMDPLASAVNYNSSSCLTGGLSSIPRTVSSLWNNLKAISGFEAPPEYSLSEKERYLLRDVLNASRVDAEKNLIKFDPIHLPDFSVIVKSSLRTDVEAFHGLNPTLARRPQLQAKFCNALLKLSVGHHDLNEVIRVLGDYGCDEQVKRIKKKPDPTQIVSEIVSNQGSINSIVSDLEQLKLDADTTKENAQKVYDNVKDPKTTNFETIAQVAKSAVDSAVHQFDSNKTAETAFNSIKGIENSIKKLKGRPITVEQKRQVNEAKELAEKSQETLLAAAESLTAARDLSNKANGEAQVRKYKTIISQFKADADEVEKKASSLAASLSSVLGGQRVSDLTSQEIDEVKKHQEDIVTAIRKINEDKAGAEDASAKIIALGGVYQYLMSYYRNPESKQEISEGNKAIDRANRYLGVVENSLKTSPLSNSPPGSAIGTSPANSTVVAPAGVSSAGRLINASFPASEPRGDTSQTVIESGQDQGHNQVSSLPYISELKALVTQLAAAPLPESSGVSNSNAETIPDTEESVGGHAQTSQSASLVEEKSESESSVGSGNKIVDLVSAVPAVRPPPPPPKKRVQKLSASLSSSDLASNSPARVPQNSGGSTGSGTSGSSAAEGLSFVDQLKSVQLRKADSTNETQKSSTEPKTPLDSLQAALSNIRKFTRPEVDDGTPEVDDGTEDDSDW